MSKTFKKILASFLVFCITLSYIPLQYAYSNYQSLVTSINLANRTTSDQRTYTIDVNWAKPNPSSTPDNAAVNGGNLHSPEGYKIYNRNGTKNGSYSLLRDVVATGDATQTETITSTLENNSIYSYYVEPYHSHSYADENRGGTYIAPNVTGSVVEALNLTDITVSSESVNGGFKVTWGNPTYMGSNVFDGYTLYYVPETTNLISRTSPSVSMNIKDDNVVFNSDGTITYVFKASNISVGQKYSIKIEPLYKGNSIRYNGITRVEIGGKSYQISYPTTDREYRYNGAYVKPSLFIKEEGTENIRLYWNEISTIIGSNVSKVEIYAYENNDMSKEELIGTLAGSATSITSWLIPTPDYLTSYKLVIHYDDGTKMESNIAIYDPTLSDFEPYRPIIHMADTNTNTSPPNFTIYWQAFLREAYTNNEKQNILSQYKNLFNDTALSYKIWISDDLTTLNDNYFQQYFILENQASNFPSTGIVVPSTQENTLAYYNTFDKYYTNVNGAYELKSLVGNKIYYVKIIATRNGTLEVSEPEYYSIYIPPTEDLELNPLTMGTPPLRIEKDENGVEIITDKTINIEWDTKWFEVYDTVTDTWHSVVGINESGKLVYGREALNLENQSNVFKFFSPYFDSEQDLSTAKALIQEKLNVSDIPVRKMDITNSQYEIFVAQYNYLETQGGYEAFYDSIYESDKWRPIAPNKANDPILKYTVSNEDAPNVGNLSPNTAYVIYMRTFTIDSNGNKIYSYNPVYVTGNTINTPTDLDITPTTQVIEAVSSTDTSVTFRWEYSSSFNYTFKYASKVIDYPNGGTVISADIIKEKGVVTVVDGKTYIYLTVNNLFPNTNYYAWINASSGKNTSSWSTPASIMTKDLETPPVPTGLGIMGTDNVRIINEANNIKYEPTGKDYIIVEWTRLYYDTVLATSGIVSDDKGYGAEILFNELITSTYGVKFNELSANKRYFFRVKSRYIAVKTAEGNAELSYSYVISMATNEDFIDAIEFEVPFTGIVDNGIDTIVKESNWSKTISFITSESSDEYDGDFDPNLYPLPETDYEIIYDPITNEVTYELRGPGLDSTGLPNNGADQRFISKVINDKIYDFSIDLSTFNEKEITNGKVVIPYSIISALEKQKVSLTVKNGNMYTKIDLGIFSDAIKAQNISGINGNTKASISIKTVSDYTILPYGQSYISKPKALAISLITENRTVNINTVEKPINIALAIDNRYIATDSNTQMYKKVNGSTTWTSVDSPYQYGANKFYYDTKNTGSFTVMKKDIPIITAGTESGNAENAIYSVNKVINIADMPYYDPNTLVSANQFNNLVWALANGESSVNINDALTSTAYTELGRSKLLVSGSYVTREKGIASIARLYELRTKQAIIPYSTLDAQGFTDSKSVDSQYQQGVNKAIDVGIISGTTIRPKDNMTLGEFIEMLEMVVLD